MKSFGAIAYEAYCEHTGWKSLVSGADLPQWSALSPEIRAAWEAAASAVLGIITETSETPEPRGGDR